MNKLIEQTVYIPKVTEYPPLPTISSIPKERWSVHETHCCFEHGCKYGNEDCPVAIGLIKQEYDCEFCGEEYLPEMDKKQGYFLTKEQLINLLTELTDNITNNVTIDLKEDNYASLYIEDYVKGVSKESITNELNKFVNEKL